jgi:protein MpaA
MMKQSVLGKSVEGRDIKVFTCFGETAQAKRFLLMGGVHGDEPQGVHVVEKFLEEELWKRLEGKATLYVIPEMNPDACAKKQRMNARGVDLNRNMATEDWDPVAHKDRYNPGPTPGSEIETQILTKFLESVKPQFIITCHTYEPMININGPCRKVAEHMAKFNKYIIAPYIGYPTPGSLGTWAGHERNIPTITLEIERDCEFSLAWETHGQALIESFLYATEHEDLDS